MVLLGVDPSFNGSGVSIYTGDSFIIRSFKKESDKSLPKNFHRVWNDAVFVTDLILSHLDDFNIDQAIVETPAPSGGGFSNGLWGLDTMLFKEIAERCNNLVYIIPCTYMGKLHGSRSYKKSQSTKLATEIIEKIGIPVDLGKFKRLNNDKAESFLMLCRLMYLNGIYTDILKDHKFDLEVGYKLVEVV